MLALAVAAWLLTPAAASAPAKAPGSLVILTNYYRVTGSNHWDFRLSKAQNRPWKNGDTFDARTDWRVTWNYEFQPVAGGFRLKNVRIVTTASITMPRLEPEPGTDPETIERWRNYFKLLMEHELGHVSIARQAGVEMRRAMSGLSAIKFNSEAELKEALDKTASRVLRTYEEKEKDFDRRTNHGMSADPSAEKPEATAKK